MSFHGLIAHFFLALNITLSGCTSLSIHLLKDILVASKFCQLGIKLLQTSLCRFLCGHTFSTPLGKYQGAWLLDQIITNMFSFVRNHQTVFWSGCTILHSHQQWMRIPIVLHPHHRLVSSVFQILAILTGVQWYLVGVLMCISLMIYDVGHLCMCLFAICMYFLGRGVCSGPCSIFNWVVCFPTVEFKGLFV